MNEDEAYGAIGVLSATTPGPWTDEIAVEWAKQFMKLSDGALLQTACQQLAASWDSKWRPTLGEVVEAYESLRQDRMRALLPSTVHCDGSGWIEVPDGRRPCRRCNTALAEVWADADKLRRYRDGAPIWTLDVGVERKRDGTLKWTNGAPPQCHPVHDGLLVVTPERGWAIARDAYLADCAERGVKPNPKRFAAWSGRGALEPNLVGPGEPRR